MNNNIKVVYILSAAFMGGATISFMNMISGLMKKGIEPIILYPRFGKKDAAFMVFLSDNKIKSHAVIVTSSALFRPRTPSQYFRFPLSFCSMIAKKMISLYKISSIIKQEKPKIIHTNVGVIHEGLKIANKYGIPHVMHLREYQDKDFDWIILPSKKTYEQFLKKSDCIICITEGIMKHFNLQKDNNAYVVYNGIYPKEDIEYRHKKECFFLCASRIVPVKGHHDVITAFAHFYKNHPEYKLVIAGFGDEQYIEKLKDMTIELLCSEAVEFVGFVSDISNLMKKAKALIVGSFYEGFGRMTAEACYNGCLVIGRETAGTKEILDKTGGFFFNDIASLAESMEKVSYLTDEQYEEKALLAQSIAIDNYSIENNVEKIYNIYKKLI